MTTEQKHDGLPVAGYRPQPQSAVDQVNSMKIMEETFLRLLDQMKGQDAYDQRWLAIGRTHIEQAFMAINRSIFKPSRVNLPGDQT